MGTGLLTLVLAAGPVAAQAPAQSPAETERYESRQNRFSVALPSGCRREEGPGTIDAVCAIDFTAEKSAAVSTASAIVLGVAVEAVSGDGDKSVAGLLQRYTEPGFREELPETVCGESDKARVKIDNINQTVEEDARVVYGADVVCSEVKFLQIGERRAAVRTIIGPDRIWRIVARAPTEDFEKQRAAIDAFLASFRVTPAEPAAESAAAPAEKVEK